MKSLDTVRSRVGKRGTLVLAAEFRRHYGLEEGDDVIQEPRPEGVLIRPATTVAERLYSDSEKDRLLLEGATTAAEYARAQKRVRDLALDSPHGRLYGRTIGGVKVITPRELAGIIT